MRSVADHAQLVVQIVFTTSSKTVGLRTSRPAPAVTQERSGSPSGERVEAGEIFVEAQHVPDGRDELADWRFARRRPVTEIRALPGMPSPIRTVRGFEPGRGTVISSVRASSSISIGGRSTSPCDSIARQRSTGSPPAPTSGSSALQDTPPRVTVPSSPLVAA